MVVERYCMGQDIVTKKILIEVLFIQIWKTLNLFITLGKHQPITQTNKDHKLKSAPAGVVFKSVRRILGKIYYAIKGHSRKRVGTIYTHKFLELPVADVGSQRKKRTRKIMTKVVYWIILRRSDHSFQSYTKFKKLLELMPVLERYKKNINRLLKEKIILDEANYEDCDVSFHTHT